ncbi:MAG TPA: hypothetical protein PLK77_17215, partial [Pyrinomonadaceae bacterium]|nr:hypothetical protein [Pyrinomonadaceae bacterium]
EFVGLVVSDLIAELPENNTEHHFGLNPDQAIGSFLSCSSYSSCSVVKKKNLTTEQDEQI